MKKSVLGVVAILFMTGLVSLRAQDEASNRQKVALAQEDRSPASAQKPKEERQGPSAPVARPSRNLSLPRELAEISRLKTCLQSEDCDYPQTDPQSYALAVGQEVEKNLKSLARLIKGESHLYPEVEKLAREWMMNPDGHIQEGALAVFSEFPPSAENLKVLVEGLQLNPADPLILKQASDELARYMGTDQEALVHQYFSKTIAEGALFTSQQAGLVLRRFLTPQSAEHYRRLLQSLPEDSTKAQYLRGTLEEYDRYTQGG